MALVTITEIKNIISTGLDDDQITAFIDMADSLVTDKLADQTCLSTTGLKQIELLLAAHFISIRDQRLTAEKVGDAGFNYQTQIGLGLDGSQYGQAAKIFDCSGVLENLGKTVMNWEIL